jgi:methyl-accepting chemotaxis protein
LQELIDAMKNLSINFILNSAVLVSLLIGISILVAFVTKSSNLMTKSMQSQNLLQTAEVIQKAVDLYIREASAAVSILSEQEEVHNAFSGNGAEAKKKFRTFLKGNENFYSVFMLDSAGRLVTGANKAGDNFAPSYEDRDYFKVIKSGRDSYVSNKVIKAKGSDNMIFVSAKALKDSSGALLGLVAVSVFWNPITAQFIDPLRFGELGYAFMTDETGQFIAHGQDKSQLLKSDASPPDFVKKMLEMKRGLLEFEHKGEPTILAIDRLPSTGWLVCVSANIKEMTAKAAEQRNMLLGIGLAVLVAVSGVITYISRKLVLDPLRRVGDFAESVAGGELKAELRGAFHFELKGLSENIRHMVAELKAKLGFAQGVLESIPVPSCVVAPNHELVWINKYLCDLAGKRGTTEAWKGKTLGSFMYNDPSRVTLADQAIDEARPLAKEIDFNASTGRKHYLINTTPFQDMDGVLLGSLTFLTDLTEICEQQAKIMAQNAMTARIAQEASSVADSLAKASEGLSARMSQLSASSKVQSDRFQETAAAVEEMNATNVEVARNAEATAKSSNAAMQKAKEGALLVSDVALAVGSVHAEASGLKNNMQTLGERVQGIGAIMSVISDIADQTNLLALNAAIEAARAGEAGRGFAVVADEVRKLAEKTMNATKEVGSAILGVQQGATETVSHMDKAVASVGRATLLAENSGLALKEIVDTVETAGDQVRSIATAADQQSAATEEINRTVADINRLTAENARLTSESSLEIERLADHAQRLNTLIAELKNDQ